MSNSSKLSYQELSDMLDNVAAELRDLMIENHELSQETKYLTDFISWMNLKDKYEYFKEYAHIDEKHELPFPPYVL